MKVQVKVKELVIKSDENEHIYNVTFGPCETVTACNSTFIKVIDEQKGISHIQECNLHRLVVSQEIFSFISSHSKETFVITLNDTSVKEVTLTYG